ncbi:hypothetical protein ACET3X_007933 [Alternaria dauci]|uniref:Uncharacterized protein n=1 Tax=Alternaria dauci TaxID=48095 RepID=A0ABR3UDC2_9PLEO
MIHPSAILVWVLGLLAVVAASPFSQSTSSDVTELAGGGSFQLVFGEMLGNRFWWLFQGPLGVAVKLCDFDERFKLIKLWPHPKPANVDSPPFPTSDLFKVDIEHHVNCWYVNDGTGEMGHIQCNIPSGTWHDFKRDLQWNNPTENCKGKRMKRAYYAEY